MGKILDQATCIDAMQKQVIEIRRLFDFCSKLLDN